MNIATDILLASAKQASAFLKHLAHPCRLMLICQLVDGEKSVGELAELVGVRQSTMSQHLSQLRLSGLVTTRREAQTVYYMLASDTAHALVRVLYEQFCMMPETKGKKRGKRK